MAGISLDGVAPDETKTYTYSEEGWKDQLMSYDGMNISYDEIGNPEVYGNWAMTWTHGRQLATMEKSDEEWAFTYNADGMRTVRTNGTATWEYIYSGSQLVQMKKGADTLCFTYDASGAPLTGRYGNTLIYPADFAG